MRGRADVAEFSIGNFRDGQAELRPGVSRQAVYNWIAAGHMLDVTFRYFAGRSKLCGVRIDQLTSRERPNPARCHIKDRQRTSVRLDFSRATRASSKPEFDPALEGGPGASTSNPDCWRFLQASRPSLANP